jgi:WD40 repeat protein
VIGKNIASTTAMAHLEVEPGAACRLSAKLGTYGYAKDEGEPLESGAISFRVAAKESTSAQAPTTDHMELVRTLPLGSRASRVLRPIDVRELVAVGEASEQKSIVKFWDSETLEESRVWRSEQPLRAFEWLPSANRILTVEADYPNGFRVRDDKTFEAITHFADHSVAVTSLAASRDGRWLASGDLGGSVILWQCDLPKNTATPKALSNHSQEVTTLAFSPDGSLLASGSLDKTVRIFDVASGQLKHTLDRTNDRIMDVRFSDDSQLLAVASWDRLIWILDPVAGNWIGSLRGPTEKANSVALSPDKSLVAAGCFDGSVLVFDRAKGHVVARADAKQDQVVGLVFLSDQAHGLRLATAHRNGMINIWGLRP